MAKNNDGMRKTIAMRISSFYERYPYPSQRVECARDLLCGEHARVMKKILKTAGLTAEELKHMRVLDAGCGTGEKALYCAILGAEVDAFDISKTSISIAIKNAARLAVKNVSYRVDDFAEVQLKKKYGLVLAMGSLHHSAEPHMNFLRLSRALMPKGRIAIGLYNVYGRLACRVRRKMLKIGTGRPEEIVRRLPHAESPARLASLADRYASPHESYHSVEEVLDWFEEAGIEPVCSEPPLNLHSRAEMMAGQLGWMLKERGFFYIGGKKMGK